MNIVPLEKNIQKRIRALAFLPTRGASRKSKSIPQSGGLPSIFPMCSYESKLIGSSFVKNHEKEVFILSISIPARPISWTDKTRKISRYQNQQNDDKSIDATQDIARL